MTKNPFLNAFAASLYISIVASIMYYGSRIANQQHNAGNTVIIPIAFLSLFTLSAAVMGYLFLYQPLQLYFEGKKHDAVNLFLRTIAVFAGITAIAFISILYRIFF